MGNREAAKQYLKRFLASMTDGTILKPFYDSARRLAESLGVTK
jgi:hypothetical protein